LKKLIEGIVGLLVDRQLALQHAFGTSLQRFDDLG
jgi:hypothetical protein